MGSYNQLAGRGLNRLEALSDGLFAVGMTLIVLEIHTPLREAIHSEQALWTALAALAPRFITYGMSFLTLGIFWVGQQTQLNQLEHGDRHLSWLHLAFLAVVAVLPFSTELLADFITFRTALLAYWINLLLLGVALFATWTYSARAGLIKADLPSKAIAAISRRIVVAQALYAFGASLCLINPYWSIGFIVLIQLNYAIAPNIPGLRTWLA
jgi:uncharacterized membrane protein